ncbi:hypothetical protein H4Q26_009737 [Puccinia striiformis f. sp. tritici PST-130]|nr:hypothetical protein H4Q26_009737 [Puccinia striiformis f. sp. tritici PST-130]
MGRKACPYEISQFSVPHNSLRVFNSQVNPNMHWLYTQNKPDPINCSSNTKKEDCPQTPTSLFFMCLYYSKVKKRLFRCVCGVISYFVIEFKLLTTTFSL